MISSVITVTNGITLKNITDNEPSIILFTRQQCVSSKKMIHMIDELSKKQSHIACVNVDMSPNSTGKTLAHRFNIVVAPSFVVYSKGKEVFRGCGFTQFERFITNWGQYV
ncbi:thioredoxin family protein [Wohlfahrtiimonas larvae]|uniref:Thioredoxin domain-containing protein n=1 Tax=Wohlfahrtiimonas larvae TaxID=1157986 RepID=A0ABP9MUB8_9GAMM|nr:thioredoxin family protein [Wohlfahrtiimonas larvae]